ncbi:hypothetical protein C1O30_03750 [Dickeya zeae]|nr:hypothetical protein C1O30_03750 [Dickeya zeae]
MLLHSENEASGRINSKKWPLLFMINLKIHIHEMKNEEIIWCVNPFTVLFTKLMLFLKTLFKLTLKTIFFMTINHK